MPGPVHPAVALGGLSAGHSPPKPLVWPSRDPDRVNARPMKVNIEIDCTPEEFKQLFIPSDKQTEFAAKAYQAMMEATQKAMIDQFRMFAKKE